jgi:hypothetical protein
MHRLRLDFGDNQQQAREAQREKNRSPDTLLRDFLERFPSRSSDPEPVPQEWLSLPLRDFQIDLARTPGGGGGTVFERITRTHEQEQTRTASPPTPAPSSTSAPAPPPPPTAEHFPTTLTDHEAVGRAYTQEIRKIGGYLKNTLSVLVVCDKILTEGIYRHAMAHSSKRTVLDDDPAQTDEDEGRHEGSGFILQREVDGPGTRIARIGRLQAGLKEDQVLVLRHLDMLVGGSGEGPPTQEARLLTEVLYRHSHDFTPTLLGFADPSISLPRVLTDRFAVRVELEGLSRDVIPHLVTHEEYDRFAQFDRETLFKNVSGFNAIQLRNAMRYLRASSQPATPTPKLMALIREFKRGSSEVEIPDITFDQIGGYEQVKQQLFEAIELITGKRPTFNPDGRPYQPTEADLAPPDESDEAREKRRKLAPRGFIFYGPPGTGKTLFAKAIANAMNATIQMVSGPEIMDMWVGKSESNLRRLFTIARRNAPAVIFFDEFDSIAAERSGSTDGGSRASNAVVAQLLTELDGFHADQDILVIGTTNRLGIIDVALLRPSRFQPVHIDLPNREARRRIAEIHAKQFEVSLPDPGVLDLIAEHTHRFNGDEIRAIFQEIARDMRQGKPVTPKTFGIQIGLIRKRRDERLISDTGTSRRSR